MAKSKSKSPSVKRTKTFTPGERWSIFFSKGDARNRVRVFPSGDTYKVSVTKSVKGTTTDRSVESFPDIDGAREQADKITATATANGWKMKLGVLANNLGLFE